MYIKIGENNMERNWSAILSLSFSGLALIASFFKILGEDFPVDPAWIAIILCGAPIIKGAFEGLIKEFDIKADVLVAIALIAAVFIGETFAAGEVAFIMTIGALLEERTVAKARAGIEKLVNLTPITARVIREGTEQCIAVEEVEVGDRIRVFAGETIPVDGIITIGQTAINQAVITGESLPIDKATGDEVFSGTVNQFGSFEMKATKIGEDSSLQRMIRLVESADADKAKIVGITDRWATWIVAIALTAAALTWFFTGEVIRAVTILVVFCPCALVLATPTAIMAGIGNAAKYGILVREGDALEKLAQVSHIVFDKTGTLTYGKPQVIAVESFDPNFSQDELLILTAAVEQRSEHPLGRAIVEHYKSVLSESLLEPRDFNMIAGKGVSAVVNHHMVLAGNMKMITEHELLVPQNILQKTQSYIDQGSTIIYTAIDQEVAGFIVLSDTLRKEAKEVIDHIKRLGLKNILLTGDHQQAALSIASKVGITQTYTECLPEDKMKVIESYQKNKEMVCMLGDGVNDAAALKKAYVGIAMGGIGSDIAIDASDITLVRDDLKVIPHLLALAKKTMRTIKVNIILSLLLNFAAILLAMTGILTPVLGALVHNLGSVAVIINASLLLKWKK